MAEYGQHKGELPFAADTARESETKKRNTFEDKKHFCGRIQSAGDDERCEINLNEPAIRIMLLKTNCGSYIQNLYLGAEMPEFEQERAMEITEKSMVLDCTTSIVAAYVANNTIQRENLPALIADTFQSLARVNRPEAVVEELKPAVPIKRSVQPDHIVCLEDGKKFKSLKRHLMSHYNMTPEEYREKWRLPADYPMVAPNYALARSALAKKMGLGRREAPVVIAEPPQTSAKSSKKAPAKKKAAGKRT